MCVMRIAHIEVKLGFVWSKMLNENYKLKILHLEMYIMFIFIMLQITI